MSPARQSAHVAAPAIRASISDTKSDFQVKVFKIELLDGSGAAKSEAVRPTELCTFDSDFGQENERFAAFWRLNQLDKPAIALSTSASSIGATVRKSRATRPSIILAITGGLPPRRLAAICSAPKEGWLKLIRVVGRGENGAAPPP